MSEPIAITASASSLATLILTLVGFGVWNKWVNPNREGKCGYHDDFVTSFREMGEKFDKFADAIYGKVNATDIEVARLDERIKARHGMSMSKMNDTLREGSG